MSTATVGVGEPRTAGQVVGMVTIAHRAPTCTCGWTGRRRFALFLARHDAWMHAARAGCHPGVPLVTAP